MSARIECSSARILPSVYRDHVNGYLLQLRSVCSKGATRHDDVSPIDTGGGMDIEVICDGDNTGGSGGGVGSCIEVDDIVVVVRGTVVSATVIVYNAVACSEDGDAGGDGDVSNDDGTDSDEKCDCGLAVIVSVTAVLPLLLLVLMFVLCSLTLSLSLCGLAKTKARCWLLFFSKDINAIVSPPTLALELLSSPSHCLVPRSSITHPTLSFSSVP